MARSRASILHRSGVVRSRNVNHVFKKKRKERKEKKGTVHQILGPLRSILWNLGT
ncbi:hypothetical protein POX_e06983 [Penicillium oxalicum]|uniref:hypothetical protein n=1 Tax=Penicillium oxalicum TaxID=69781 RepID=UPI0020B7A505|nr:hypothetical protein POX_e06983 [Penicillium oxalicum]KAI2788958.1 hypothetical protein POX_e06983 [Penicillium oxalicum]